MTDRTFLDIAKVLKLVYKRDDFLANRDAMDLWFRLLSDLSDDDVTASVAEWMKASQYPPTIADIRKGAERYEEERRDKRAAVKQEFDAIAYPGKDAEDEKTFYLLVYSLPEEKWVSGARYLNRMANKAVRSATKDVEKLETVLRKAAKR